MQKYELLISMALGILATKANADVFNMGFGLASLDTVQVGDAGNEADTRNGSYGAVDYPFKIGKYEVTAAQYAEFLNAVAKTDAHGLYNLDMLYEPNACNIERDGEPGSYSYSVDSEFGNRPVNYVNYWAACRFVNWLQNGQPTGLQNSSTTEDGAYTLNEYDGNEERPIRRKSGAKWYLPTEDEWYKAAYYKGGGVNAGYWEYPTKSDKIDPTMANYAGKMKHTTDVGAYAAYPGPYGTFDQGGNVDEWIEVHIDRSGCHRTLRGGGEYYGTDGYYLRASTRLTINVYPTYVFQDIGFRIAGFISSPLNKK